MSDHSSEIPTVRLRGPNEGNSIRFAPFGQAPTEPEGRLFEVRGNYEPEALTRAGAFLTAQCMWHFKTIGPDKGSGGDLRIVLQPNAGWRHASPFTENTPAALIAIHERLGDGGHITVLAYTIFVFCHYLGWDASSTVIEEISAAQG